MSKVITLTIEEKTLSRGEHTRHDRDRILTDILKSNQFTVEGMAAEMLEMRLSILEGRLCFTLKAVEEGSEEKALTFSMTPLRTVIRDYHIVCDSYLQAVKEADPRRVEAIDMGRRGLHDEGATLLQELLEPQVTTDHETARHLFGLLAVLQRK